MIFWLFISLIIPILLGYAIVNLIWPAVGIGWAIALFRWCLAFIIGIGCSWCLFFLWLLVLDSPHPAFIPIEATVTIALFGWSLARRRTTAPTTLVQPPALSTDARPHPLLLLCIALICIAGVGSMIISAVRSPDGAYDAWAIWNTHARFIFRGGDHWRDLFLPGSSAHPDYPLLIPGAVARGWLFVGIETPLVPILIGTGFALATAGLLFTTLTLLSGWPRAAIALAFLLGASHYVYDSASQMADVPLGAYFLATLALYALWSCQRDRPELAVLMGLTAALAGWTKNEGLLFLVVFSGVLGVAQFRELRREGLRAFRRLVPFVVGLLPIVALILYFKLALAPQNDLVAGQSSAATLARVFSIARIIQITRAYITWLATFGRGVIVVLAAYLVVMRGREGFRSEISISVGTVVVLLMLIGYFGVFLTTPHDLTWHLAALERLLVQLWPTALLVVFSPRQL